ncbi:MAG TPA: hypothetical protein VGA33_00945 [Thermoanaerobaculia bacterium]
MTEMLEQLPGRMRQAGRHNSSQLRIDVFDGVIEARVRVFPIEKLAQMLAECGVTHALLLDTL